MLHTTMKTKQKNLNYMCVYIFIISLKALGYPKLCGLKGQDLKMKGKLEDQHQRLLLLFPLNHFWVLKWLLRHQEAEK